MSDEPSETVATEQRTALDLIWHDRHRRGHRLLIVVHGFAEHPTAALQLGSLLDPQHAYRVCAPVGAVPADRLSPHTAMRAFLERPSIAGRLLARPVGMVPVGHQCPCPPWRAGAERRAAGTAPVRAPPPASPVLSWTRLPRRSPGARRG